MGNFKLIAITPLANCEEAYRKNLIPAQTYKFYNNYNIKTDEMGRALEVVRPDSTTKVPDTLYELKNGINLSISAVVGKNGTGKSSLFEMLFYFIYAVYSKKNYNGRRILYTEFEDIKAEHASTSDDYLDLSSKIQAADTFENESEKWTEYTKLLPDAVNLMKHYKINLPDHSFVSPEALVKGVRGKLLDNNLSRLYSRMQQQEKEDEKLSQTLSVAVIFESDGIINEIAYDCGTFSYRSFDSAKGPTVTSIQDFKIEDFFYTICINYSHHGLNSNSIGTWINKLFHKNDAYFTPVVINPMRTEGKFDINKEMALSKERLMANLLYDIVNNPKAKLLGKYKIASFIFTPKIARPKLFMPFKENPIEKLTSKELLHAEGITEMYGHNSYWDFALTYLEHKVHRISKQYAFVIYDENDRTTEERAAKLIKYIREKKNHITKKVTQTINFLVKTHAPENRDIWKMGSNHTRSRMSPKKMRLWMELFSDDLGSLTPSELAEFGPPGFFNFDLLLKTPDKSLVRYSDLSSGEQQMILNTNAILYHLYNIHSIHNDKGNYESLEDKRIRYRHVNIVLDEIELYYHPEMQRKLVSDLITSFERIKKHGKHGIEAINLTLLTHSPFILSDIPHQNILSLTKDAPPQEHFGESNTFGGNIHEILIEKFFMDATIGQYSVETIQELIDLYQQAREADTGSKLKALKAKYHASAEKYEFIVNNVGEEVIREILTNNLDYIKFLTEN